MNKKLIVIGIAAALAAPLVAQAGVEVYGKARVSFDVNNNDNDTPNVEKNNTSVSSNASRIGFKGDEDLGGGLTALWQFETEVAFDTGTWNSANRQSFIGVAGGFGTVLAGRLDTPYKSATNSWDPFIDTKADYNDIMGGSRVSNTLAYMTPNMNGFTGALAYVNPVVDTTGTGQGDSITQTTPTSTQKKQSAVSLSGNYANGPLNVAAGYEVANKLGASKGVGVEPDNFTQWKLGATYTIMEATTLGLIYENQDVGGTIKDHNNFYLLATHKIGDTTLKLAYTKADKWSGNGCYATGTGTSCDQTGADQVSVGVYQSLTKNTEVYALYSQISNDDHALSPTGTGYGFAGGPGSITKVSGIASDPSVISLGINHNFSSK
jgi:predicted porin